MPDISDDDDAAELPGFGMDFAGMVEWARDNPREFARRVFLDLGAALDEIERLKAELSRLKG